MQMLASAAKVYAFAFVALVPDDYLELLRFNKVGSLFSSYFYMIVLNKNSNYINLLFKYKVCNFMLAYNYIPADQQQSRQTRSIQVLL